MKPRRRLILTLEDTGRLVPLFIRVRRLLKLMLRSFGLRVVDVRFEPPELEVGLERVWGEMEKKR